MGRGRKSWRVYASHAGAAPETAVWCGDGSPWANPFKGPWGWAARQLAERRNPTPRPFGEYGFLRSRPVPRANFARAASDCYRCWITGSWDHMPESVKREARKYIDAPGAPKPPTREAIVAQLTGKGLAAAETRGTASHVDVLLEFINGWEPTF